MNVGSLPYELCFLTKLTSLNIDDSGISVPCTPLCLSSIAVSGIPGETSECPMISAGIQAGLCGLITATNIASIYPQWKCTPSGVVVSQPCSGVSPTWSGGIICSSAGEVTGLALSNFNLIGNDLDL